VRAGLWRRCAKGKERGTWHGGTHFKGGWWWGEREGGPTLGAQRGGGARGLAECGTWCD
jgi:hypothetical protein